MQISAHFPLVYNSICPGRIGKAHEPCQEFVLAVRGTSGWDGADSEPWTPEVTGSPEPEWNSSRGDSGGGELWLVSPLTCSPER